MSSGYRSKILASGAVALLGLGVTQAQAQRSTVPSVGVYHSWLATLQQYQGNCLSSVYVRANAVVSLNRFYTQLGRGLSGDSQDYTTVKANLNYIGMPCSERFPILTPGLKADQRVVRVTAQIHAIARVQVVVLADLVKLTASPAAPTRFHPGMSKLWYDVQRQSAVAQKTLRVAAATLHAMERQYNGGYVYFP